MNLERNTSKSENLGNRGGFTLAEMLVVIGILAVLTGLLLPAISSALRSAKTTACSSNLRQLGVAAQLYSSDNDQRLIPMCTGTGAADAQTWRIYMEPYLGVNPDKGIFACPADITGMKDPSPYTHGTSPASYGMNEAGARAPNATISDYVFDYLDYLVNHHKAGFIKNPSRTIFISDLGRPDNPSAPPSSWVENRGLGAASYGYARFPNETAYSVPGDDWNIYPRHGGNRANALFFDGHVSSVDIITDLVAHPPGDPDCIYDNH